MKYRVVVERASVDTDVNTYELTAHADTGQIVRVRLTVDCTCREIRDDLITAMSKAVDECISNANNEGK